MRIVNRGCLFLLCGTLWLVATAGAWADEANGGDLLKLAKTHFKNDLWPAEVKLFNAAPTGVNADCTSDLADSDSPELSVGDFTDLTTFAGRLLKPVDVSSAYLNTNLSFPTKDALTNYHGLDSIPLQILLVRDLNQLVKGQSIFEVQRFASVFLRSETQKYLAMEPPGNTALVNRLLLEDAFPEISRRHYSTNAVIRADRLQWLCTDPVASKKITRRGVAISNGWVEGMLDLDGANMDFSLTFENCHFLSSITLQYARLASLDLTGSHIYGLNAQRAVFKDSVELSSGFQSEGEVNLWEATIGGDLDFSAGYLDNPGTGNVVIRAANSKITGSLYLNAGFRSEGEVNFFGASIGGDFAGDDGQFDNPGTNNYAINVGNSKIGGDVFCTANVMADGVFTKGFTAEGQVVFSKSTIGGDLNCFGGHFFNPGGLALNADGANIVGNVYLNNTNFLGAGQVSLQNTSIGINLNCQDGHFVNPGSNTFALSAARAKIGGDVYLKCTSITDGFLTNGFQAEGEIDFTGTTIKGDLNGFAGHFINPNAIALTADEANIGGNVYLTTTNFLATGLVSLENATIGMNLNCQDGRFFNPDTNWFALSAARAKIGGDVYLNASATADGDLTNGFTAVGSVYLYRVTINGNLVCRGGHLVCSNAIALDAEGANIGGYVFLNTTNFTAAGEVSLLNAVIGLNLECEGGHFSNHDTNRYAIYAESASIKGNALLRYGFNADGGVRLMGASIGGDLDCTAGHFASSNTNVAALDAEMVKIGGDVLMKANAQTNFAVEGAVSFTSATIGGDLNCNGGRFGSPTMGFCNFDANDAKIEGNVYLLDQVATDCKMNFVDASIGRDFQWRPARLSAKSGLDLSLAKMGSLWLWDQRAGWPAVNQLVLDGLVYDQIHFENTDDYLGLLDWLGRQDTNQFAPQPYEQLASVLRKTGHDDDAGEVMIAKNEAHRQHTTPLTGSWWWYNVFGWIVGYGYNPWRPFGISLVIIFLGTVVFWRARENNLLLPADEKSYTWKKEKDKTDIRKPDVGKSYPAFNPFIYSLEMFVPLLKLDMGDLWRPNEELARPLEYGGLRAYLWFHVIIGWILTTLWVGGLTGLVKS